MPFRARGAPISGGPDPDRACFVIGPAVLGSAVGCTVNAATIDAWLHELRRRNAKRTATFLCPDQGPTGDGRVLHCCPDGYLSILVLAEICEACGWSPSLALPILADCVERTVFVLGWNDACLWWASGPNPSWKPDDPRRRHPRPGPRSEPERAATRRRTDDRAKRRHPRRVRRPSTRRFDPLLGDRDNILIPANGDVMFYGDGGAGKTTLCLDLACHLAAGTTGSASPIPAPPRAARRERRAAPLFRESRTANSTPGPRRRSATGCASSRSRGPRSLPAKPTANCASPADRRPRRRRRHHRPARRLRHERRRHPRKRSAQFLALCADVRHRAGRPVTFVLIHHENKGGKVSGAWEGAGDTLLHVTGRGPAAPASTSRRPAGRRPGTPRRSNCVGPTAKGSRSSTSPEITDDDLAERILAAIAEHPGTGWNNVRQDPSVSATQRRQRCATGCSPTAASSTSSASTGVDNALDHCPETAAGAPAPRRRPRHHASASGAGRRRDADCVRRGRAENESASLRPDLRRDAGRDADLVGDPRQLELDPTEGDR